MSINNNLLIAAPMLQDYFVDKATGLPLNGGIITCYVDTARTTLKNWYYQTGTPGAYTYSALPNPLTLSAVGTIDNGNGNDVIPYFYPYDESDNVSPQTYYITVDNSEGTRQFTRANFPFLPESSFSNEVPTLKNYLVNNVFWRNAGSLNLTGSSLTAFTYNSGTAYYATLAPSQHDGFAAALSDINYLSDQTDGTQTATFNVFVAPSATAADTFQDQVLDDDITPEFYLNFACSVAGSATYKVINIPLSLHIKSMSGVNGTFTIQAMNNGGSVNNEITIQCLQFLGTGVTTSAASEWQTITLSNEWEKYEINAPIPSATNVTTSAAGDDALYVQIAFPVGGAFDINIALPSYYVSDSVPTNNFVTYDEVASITDSPRTGDVRMSLNSFAPFGWVACNDGTIGDASSNSTARANIDTFPLYSLIWHGVGSTYAPIYTSANVNSTYGASAYADFIAHKQLALTKTLGQVLAGTMPTSSLLAAQTYTVNTGVSTSNLILPANRVTFMPTGTPVILTNSGGAAPNGLSTGVVYYSISVDATHIKLASTIANALAGTAVTFSDNGSGTNQIQPKQNALGYIRGEESHILTSTELPNPITTSAQNSLISAGAGAQNFIASDTATGAGTISNSGGNQPHNTMQPTTYFNVFLKL